MDKRLKKKYLLLVLPVIAGFLLAYCAKRLGGIAVAAVPLPQIVSPAIFILSAVFAIALPIFYRTLFAHRRRGRLSVSENDLLKLEGNSIVLAMVAPYLALIAYILEIPRFHFCGTILLGLYAVYYLYPSRKRLAFQKRVFRVKT